MEAVEGLTRGQLCVLGALVGDAACMPLHWIYEETKVLKLLGNQEVRPEFFGTASCPYYSAREFPGHYAPGQLSPYGEQMLAVARLLARSQGNVDPGKFAAGLGEWAGVYSGRVDHATTLFAKNLEAGKAYPEVGADDNQAQCFGKASLAVARFGHNGIDCVLRNLEVIVRVHQNSDLAVDCATVIAKLLFFMIAEALPIAEAWAKVKVHGDGIPPSLEAAVTRVEANLDGPAHAMLLVYGAGTNPGFPAAGLSCGNPQAFMGWLHAVLTASSFEGGLRATLLTCGDNCARATGVGPVLALAYGVPRAWLARCTDPFLSELKCLAPNMAAPEIPDADPAPAASPTAAATPGTAAVSPPAPAPAPGPRIIYKQGKLTKLGATVKSWKTRFVELTEASLTYFTDFGGRERGQIPVRKIKGVRKTKDKEIRHAHGFAVEAEGHEGRKPRTYYFCGANGGEVDQWIAAVEMALAASAGDCLVRTVTVPVAVPEPEVAAPAAPARAPPAAEKAPEPEPAAVVVEQETATPTPTATAVPPPAEEAHHTVLFLTGWQRSAAALAAQLAGRLGASVASSSPDLSALPLCAGQPASASTRETLVLLAEADAVIAVFQEGPTGPPAQVLNFLEWADATGTKAKGESRCRVLSVAAPGGGDDRVGERARQCVVDACKAVGLAPPAAPRADSRNGLMTDEACKAFLGDLPHPNQPAPM